MASRHSKPALILIHGFRGAPLGLEEIAQELRTADYDVHVPAIPPYANASPLAEYTPASYANFIKSYITKNHLDHPILIGHSMGSIIATATATFYPDLTHDKLILLAPISTKPPKFFRLISPLSSLLPLKMVDYITTKYLFTPQKDRDIFPEVMKLTTSCSHLNPPKHKDSRAVTKFSANYCVADFSPKKSVTIIVGEHDSLIKQTATRALAEKWQAETIFIPGSGHLHTYEKPHETAAAILDKLSTRS